MSVFLNPAGTDLVILREGEGRTPRIDHVEMAYYWLVVTEALDDHLTADGGGIRPSGGCRVPSLQIPQWRIGTLASFAVERIFRQPPGDGYVEILRLGDAGLSVVSTPVPRFHELTIAEFTIAISAEVCERVSATRAAAGGNETGGILIGSWDRTSNVLYVVAVTGAPSDSVGTPMGFERGIAGVYRTLERVETATAGRRMAQPPTGSGHPPKRRRPHLAALDREEP